MKALVYKAPDKIEVDEVEKPSLDDGQVLIKVKKAGICGSDIGIIHGAHPRVVPPLIPGHEFSGEIVESSFAEKSKFKVGDRVAVFPLIFCGECLPCKNGYPHVCCSLNLVGIDCPGGFGEYVAVDQKHLLKLPDDVSYLKGALTEPLAVGIHAVEMCRPEKDDFIVVMGAGPIGLMVSFSLEQQGYEKILIADINEKRLERAGSFGIESANAKDVLEKVMEKTKGQGADIIYECAGASPAALVLNALMRPRGRAVIVSVHKKNPEIDLRAMNFKETSFIGARVYTQDNFQKAIELVKGLDESKFVSHTFPVEKAVEAFETFQNPQEDTCKIVIDME